jgi:GTPase-associated system helical domain
MSFPAKNRFDTAAEAINATFGTMAKKFNSAVEATADFVAIQDEELEMLWWVLGERSNGVKKSFSSIPEAERPLVLSAELAQATIYLPGPLSVEGLLTRAGLKSSKTFTIPQVVNACAHGWLEPFVSGKAISPLLQPIHFAIQRKLETGDETSWVSGWAGSSSLDATTVFPSIILGLLFYRERLLSIF